MSLENLCHGSPLRLVSLLKELLDDVCALAENDTRNQRRLSAIRAKERKQRVQLAKTSVESRSMLGKISWNTMAFSSSVAKSSFV